MGDGTIRTMLDDLPVDLESQKIGNANTIICL